jgi:hypothetical protein
MGPTTVTVVAASVTSDVAGHLVVVADTDRVKNDKMQ